MSKPLPSVIRESRGQGEPDESHAGSGGSRTGTRSGFGMARRDMCRGVAPAMIGYGTNTTQQMPLMIDPPQDLKGTDQ
jgi:hypothetical protein